MFSYRSLQPFTILVIRSNGERSKNILLVDERNNNKKIYTTSENQRTQLSVDRYRNVWCAAVAAFAAISHFPSLERRTLSLMRLCLPYTRTSSTCYHIWIVVRSMHAAQRCNRNASHTNINNNWLNNAAGFRWSSCTGRLWYARMLLATGHQTDGASALQQCMGWRHTTLTNTHMKKSYHSKFLRHNDILHKLVYVLRCLDRLKQIHSLALCQHTRTSATENVTIATFRQNSNVNNKPSFVTRERPVQFSVGVFVIITVDFDWALRIKRFLFLENSSKRNNVVVWIKAVAYNLYSWNCSVCWSNLSKNKRYFVISQKYFGSVRVWMRKQ